MNPRRIRSYFGKNGFPDADLSVRTASEDVQVDVRAYPTEIEKERVIAYVNYRSVREHKRTCAETEH